MKKLLTICLMAVCLAIGGTSLEAKTTKKSSSRASTSAGITKKLADGTPDITGHTYVMTDQGIKTTARFRNDGYVSMNFSNGKRSENLTFYWSYQGGNKIAIFADDGSDSLLLYISDDGKKIYAINDWYEIDEDTPPFKLVK